LFHKILVCFKTCAEIGSFWHSFSKTRSSAFGLVWCLGLLLFGGYKYVAYFQRIFGWIDLEACRRGSC